MTDTYISLQEATKYCNYSQEYLSLRARQGKLKSVKFGRNWMTTREWLEDYVKKTEDYNNKINNKRLEEQKIEKKIEVPVAVLKKVERIPQNLPIEKIPTLRFGFAATLVIVLILATGVFGRESFRYVSRSLPLFVREFSQGFDRGAADSSLKLKIKKEKLTEDLSYYAHLVGTAGDIIVEEITKPFTQGFGSVAEGIKIFFSVEYQTADVGEALGRSPTGEAFKDYGRWIGTNLKSGYSAANEKLENFVSSLGTNLETIPDKVFQKYQAVNDLLKKQISFSWQKTKTLVTGLFSVSRKVAVPSQEISRETVTIETPTTTEQATTTKDLVKEVPRITKIEPSKEIIREKETIVIKTDEESRKSLLSLQSRMDGYDQEIISLQTDMNRRSSGFMVSPATVQPVFQSPNIVYTVGGGADTDWIMSGTTMYANNTITNVGIGTTSPAYTLDIYGDINLTGTLYQSGAAAVFSNWTRTNGDIYRLSKVGIGTSTISAMLDVYATSTTALIINQAGTGNIAQFINATGTVLTLSNNGNLSLAGNILPSTTTTYDLGSSAYKWANIYTATATIGNTITINTDTISATSSLNLIGAAASTWKTTAGALTIQSADVLIVSSTATTTLTTAAGPILLLPTTYVGIGTSTPVSTLSVYGTSTFMGGYVGIGTTTPGVSLAVVGNIWGSGNITMLGTASAGTSTISGDILPSANTIYNLGSASFQWANVYTATATIGSITINSTDINSSGALNLTAAAASLWKTTGNLTIQSVGNLTASSSGNLLFSTAGTERMRIASTTGYVGIGTASPSSTLGVYGTTTLTGGYVGIGTTTPAYTLDAYGTFRALSTSTFGGYVGIGTTTPAYTLSVVGNIYGSGNAIFSGTLAVSSTSSLATTTITGGYLGVGTTTPASTFGVYGTSTFMGGNVGIGTTTPATTLTVYGTTTLMGGYVGIGTTVPTYKLDVNGTFRAISTSTFSGNVGIGTTTPSALLDVYASSTAYGLSVKQQMTGGIVDFKNATGSVFTIINTGNVGIGTTSPGYLLDVYRALGATSTIARFGAFSSDTIVVGGGAGKITVGTWDPVYSIEGVKYATYGLSIIGMKEETTGVINVKEQIEGKDYYQYVVDFNNLETGSDLWLFSKTTNLKQNFDKLVVLLSPAGNTRVWYQAEPIQNKLIFYASRPTVLSYRLTAPRFDWQEWSNLAKDAESITGFVIDDNGGLTSSGTNNYVFDEKNNSATESPAETGFDASNITQSIKDFIKDTLAFLTGDIKAAGTWIFEKIFVKNAKIENLEVKNNVVIYDKKTGDPYCVGIEDGSLVSKKGKCEGEQPLNPDFQDSISIVIVNPTETTPTPNQSDSSSSTENTTQPEQTAAATSTAITSGP